MGENTVGELAEFIQANYSGYKSFTRRGLYRMKQFYEVYSSDQFLSSLAKQLEGYFLDLKDEKVSAVPTQLEDIKNQFITSLLCKITWTNHLEILSKTKSAEKKFLHLIHCIKERWSMRDLRRQLNTAYFERSILKKGKKSVGYKL